MRCPTSALPSVRPESLWWFFHSPAMPLSSLYTQYSPDGGPLARRPAWCRRRWRRRATVNRLRRPHQARCHGFAMDRRGAKHLRHVSVVPMERGCRRGHRSIGVQMASSVSSGSIALLSPCRSASRPHSKKAANRLAAVAPGAFQLGAHLPFRPGWFTSLIPLAQHRKCVAVL